MRMFLSLIFLMIFTIVDYSNAQTTGILHDGLNWFYRGQYVHEEYEIGGSKAMNGKDYKLLTIIRGGYDSRALVTDNSMSLDKSYYDYIRASIGIREENGRIYVDKDEYLSLLTEDHPWINVVDGEPLPYETTAEGELVLYDFTKKEGEVYLQIDGGTTLTVTKTHTLKTEDGVTRRCLTLNNGYEIIEGVGSVNSPGMLLFWLNMKPEYNDYGAMGCFWLKLAEGNNMVILAQDIDAMLKKQGGHPSILQQGRRWVYDYNNGNIEGTLTYNMDGYTLNQGYKGYKIQMTLVDKKSEQTVKTCYAGALFEKQGMVTYLAPDKNQDEPLYCFDKVNYIRPKDYSLMTIGTDDIKLADINYHRILLVNKRDSVPLEKDSLYYWVEGIGSSRGLLGCASGALIDSIQFVACYDGEKCIFTNEDFTKNSGKPLTYDGYLDISGLRYHISLSTETARVSSRLSSIDSLVIPPSLKIWGIDCDVVGIFDYAFSNCTDIKSVTLPESILSIGESAFQNSGLKEIVIPESVKSIGIAAFKECPDLVSVSLPSNLSTIERSLFWNCKSLQEVTLPENLKTIGTSAFGRCVSLKTVDLPATLTKLEYAAFKLCENLTDVYCRAMTPPDANALGVFSNISPGATLHVPNDVLQVYKNTNKWADFKYIVPIEDANGILVHKPEVSLQRIFDLQGRPVKGTPKKGIYVKDGRKVAW